MGDKRLNRSRTELAGFLRHARARLTPADVGLPSGDRRRTPGLRREEVAALAGVGLSWYTWLEQGREINPSERFLDRLADVLQLDELEHRHLFLLAHKRPPAADADSAATVSPMAQRLLGDLTPRPAYVMNARWDVLAWNTPADRIFAFSDHEDTQRNLLWIFFVDPEMRERLVEWEEQAPGILGSFQRSYARVAAHDPTMHETVTAVERLSPTFRRLWNQYQVNAECRGRRTFRIEGIGAVPFEHMSLTLDERQHLYLVLYEADDNNACGAAFKTQMCETVSESEKAHGKGNGCCASVR
ncbi:helix-turn-helix transcriptional regulator [Arhodomonas sp. AD133]|uniref:helix-turn-helix transcriptional regulator n=1 Tax=Arhodomonas sp. AD133 TaxID=3415009 RepID=UPI003EBBAF81